MWILIGAKFFVLKTTSTEIQETLVCKWLDFSFVMVKLWRGFYVQISGQIIDSVTSLTKTGITNGGLLIPSLSNALFTHTPHCMWRADGDK